MDDRIFYPWMYVTAETVINGLGRSVIYYRAIDILIQSLSDVDIVKRWIHKYTDTIGLHIFSMFLFIT